MLSVLNLDSDDGLQGLEGTSWNFTQNIVFIDGCVFLGQESVAFMKFSKGANNLK